MNFDFTDIDPNEILDFTQRINHLDEHGKSLKDEEQIAVWMAKTLAEHGTLKRKWVLEHISREYYGEYYDEQNYGKPNIHRKVLQVFRKLYGNKATWSGYQEAWILKR